MIKKVYESKRSIKDQSSQSVVKLKVKTKCWKEVCMIQEVNWFYNEIGCSVHIMAVVYCTVYRKAFLLNFVLDMKVSYWYLLMMMYICGFVSKFVHNVEWVLVFPVNSTSYMFYYLTFKIALVPRVLT